MCRLQELIEILSDENVQVRTYEAKRLHICKICKRPAVEFETSFSKFEYRLSTICEACQNYYYDCGDDSKTVSETKKIVKR